MPIAQNGHHTDDDVNIADVMCKWPTELHKMPLLCRLGAAVVRFSPENRFPTAQVDPPEPVR
jgi:hypothetical protein